MTIRTKNLTTKNQLMDADAEMRSVDESNDDDPVIKEFDVYLNRSNLSSNNLLYILQVSYWVSRLYQILLKFSLVFCVLIQNVVSDKTKRSTKRLQKLLGGQNQTIPE